MLIIQCPYCGERPEIEFHHGGEAHIGRPVDPGALTDAEWADYLYNRTNPKGLRSEEHTSELQSRTLSSYAVFCLKKKKI